MKSAYDRVPSEYTGALVLVGLVLVGGVTGIAVLAGASASVAIMIAGAVALVVRPLVWKYLARRLELKETTESRGGDQ